MNKYVVIEAQNLNSVRKGTEVQAKSLTDAKRKASRMQAFVGTSLSIESINGERLAYKERGKWHDTFNEEV